MLRSPNSARAIRTFILVAVLIVFAIPAFALPPAHFWSKRFGAAQEQTGQAVVVDASGNIIMVGNFSDTVDFGGGALVANGSGDFVVAKYSPTGAHIWSKRYGGTSYEDVHGVDVDAAGNIFVTGQYLGITDLGGGPLPSAGSNDAFLAKLDSNGNHVWSKRFGNTLSDYGYSVAVDNLGNVFATGMFNASVSFGGSTLVSAGSSDIYLAKYDNNGTHIWSNRYGSVGWDQSTSMALDGSNSPVITGYCENDINFGGSTLTGFGAYDVFLAKFDSNDNHVFSKRFGTINYDGGYGVATDNAGNILLTGNFVGTINFGGSNLVSFSDEIFLARFTTTGVHVWSQRLGGTGGDYGVSVAIDGVGNNLVAGMFTGTVDFGGGNLVSAGGWDLFVAKYDVNGSHLWSRRSGGTDGESFPYVTLDADNNVIMTGRFQQTANFGGANFVSAGASDAFLAKYGLTTESPVISSIIDVGNDQGRAVNIRFLRSGHDQLASPTPIVQYDLYRRPDPAPSLVVETAAPAALSSQELLASGWTFAGSVPAHGEPAYRVDAPTIGDSTIALGQYRSVFYVRAATSSGPVFFDSPPDSGYSKDNLAPGAPQNFIFTAGDLSWNESTAKDFDYFTVYGSNTDNFGAATVVDYSITTAMDVTASPYVFYYVTATDFSGNEGKFAKVNSLSGVGGTPTSYVLSVSNYPNPFNPRTTVSYTVPSRGRVRVTIYDVRGALVATLVDKDQPSGAYTIEWDGLAQGSAVGSGIYFARIEHATGTRSKKMVLLK